MYTTADPTGPGRKECSRLSPLARPADDACATSGQGEGDERRPGDLPPGPNCNQRSDDTEHQKGPHPLSGASAATATSKRTMPRRPARRAASAALLLAAAGRGSPAAGEPAGSAGAMNFG